jgi:acyl phosphate:glycerol-3-phosphate acyltransferase
VNHAGVMMGLAAASYLLGAVPFGFLIARARGVDIRSVGSGNIGATNVFRTLGKACGIATLLCDCLKGFIPAYVFPQLARCSGADCGPSLSVLCGCLAVAGHNWPVFLRFRGGKGVATTAGALLGIAPLAATGGLVAWVAMLLTTRYVSVASMAAAITIAAVAWVQHAFASAPGVLVPCALTGLAALAIWRHRGNIRRLADGTENRFDFRKKRGAVKDEGAENGLHHGGTEAQRGRGETR